MAYIQKVLTRRAIESGFMADDEATKTQAYEKLFEIAVQRSRELYKEFLSASNGRCWCSSN